MGNRVEEGELDTSPAKDPKISAPAPLAEKKRRLDYTHLNCETDSKMDGEMSDRFYGDPDSVTSLYCSGCGCGIRIGKDGEMVWTGTKDKVIPGDVPAKD